MDELANFSDEQLLALVGVQIRSLLRHQGRTQKWLAEQLDCHPTAVGNWLAGRRDMGISTLARVTSLLRASPGDLLPSNPSSATPPSG